MSENASEPTIYSFTPQNKKRMKRGVAPLVYNPFKQKLESVQLQRAIDEYLFDFIEISTDELAKIDEYRHVGDS